MVEAMKMSWKMTFSFPSRPAGMMTPCFRASNRKTVMRTSRPTRRTATHRGRLPHHGMP